MRVEKRVTMSVGRGPASVTGVADGNRPAPGTPCWAGLRVHALSRAQDFYGAVFGWEFEPGTDPERLGDGVRAYGVRALLNGIDVAEVASLPPGHHHRAVWTPSLASDDIETVTAAIGHRGGTVGVGPLAADGTGRLAFASDPVGAVFGIRQTTTHHLAGTPGSPVWHELLTYHAARVTPFYEQIFGLETERPDMDEEAADCDEPGGDEAPRAGRMILRAGGRPVASVRVLDRRPGRERGPRWTTYFRTMDIDATAARVVELGGSTLEPPHETAFGRMAVVADPEHAAFGLLTP
jgi:uncharacterized protein